ncbi:unnamed protein product [Sympodiomycopsis kandeliae]
MAHEQPRFCISAVPGKQHGCLHLGVPTDSTTEAATTTATTATTSTSTRSTFTSSSNQLLLATSAQSLYNDLYLSFAADDDQPPQGRSRRSRFTNTGPRSSATKLLRARNFKLAWSATVPPPQRSEQQHQQQEQPSSLPAPPTSHPHAMSLFDDQGSQLIQEMLDIIDRYLAVCPAQRDIETYPGALPGRFLGSAANLIDDDKGEDWYNTCFGVQHLPLINHFLALCHRAVLWASDAAAAAAAAADTTQTSDDEMMTTRGEQTDKEWPVPLDHPLVLKSKPKRFASVHENSASTSTGSRRPRSPSIPEEQATAKSDFWLYHNDDIIGLIESKPHMGWRSAKQWAGPQLDPLTPPRDDAQTQISSNIPPVPQIGPVPSSSHAMSTRQRPMPSLLNPRGRSRPFGRRTAVVRSHESRQQDGYGLANWKRKQKLTLQLVSQLYFHKVTSGALLADWGRVLVFYELHPLPRIDDDDDQASQSTAQHLRDMVIRKSRKQMREYALCIAPHALYTWVPESNTEQGSAQHPDVIVAQCNANSSPASSSAATATAAPPPPPPPPPAAAAAAVHVSRPTIPNNVALTFASRPGSVFGLVHWALGAFATRRREEQERRRQRQSVAEHEEADLVGILAHDAGSRQGGPSGSTGILGRFRGSRSEHSTRQTSHTWQTGRRGAAAAAAAAAANSPSIITALLVIPAPFAFGTYANVYRGKPITKRLLKNRSSRSSRSRSSRFCGAGLQETYGASMSIAEWRSAKTILKVHREPIDEDEWRDVKYAPSLLPADRRSTSASVQERTAVEVAAYQRLKSLQGTFVPKLIGLVPPHMPPESCSWKIFLEVVGSPLGQLSNEQSDLCILWRSQIYKATVEAVRACHALGIVHGDLHLGNIVAEWLTIESAQHRQDQVISPAKVYQMSKAAMDRSGHRTAMLHRAALSCSSSQETSIGIPSGSSSTSLSDPDATTGANDPSSFDTPASSQLLLHNDIRGHRTNGNMEQRTGLRLRVAIIDWSQARFETSEEEQRDEMQGLLDDLAYFGAMESDD